MSHITIYHNPRCSKSRQALSILKERGLNPEVVLYQKTPPTIQKLSSIIGSMGVTPRDIMRIDEDVYAELNLGNPELTDDELMRAMVENPILINRPIVVTDKGVRLCRPMERLEEILP